MSKFNQIHVCCKINNDINSNKIIYFRNKVQIQYKINLVTVYWCSTFTLFKPKFVLIFLKW